MKRKRIIRKTDDGKLDDLVGRYFQKAEGAGVEDSGTFDSDGVYQKIKDNITTKTRRLKTQTRIFWAAAASIAVLLGILAVLQQRPTANRSSVVMAAQSAGTGRTLQVKLDDGTVIWLNAGSTVRYPATFAVDKREVFIEGEAYLEVAQDAKRPFMVYTGDVVTKVLGTSFNVAAFPADKQVEVTVLTGKVSLSSRSGNAAGTLLTQGQQAAYAQDGKLLAFNKDVDAAESILWKDHKMIYNGKKLSQVAASLERWYGIKISPDAHLSACTISADFTGEPVESVMTVLAQLVNGKAIRTANGYQLTGEGCIY